MGSILIRCGISTELLLECCKFGGCTLRIGHGHILHQLGSQSRIQNVCFVLGVELGAEFIAGSDCQWPLMVGQANKWRNAPSFLVHVEQKFGNIPKHGMLNSLDVSPVVTIIVVGTETDSSRQTVKNLVGKVDLSAIDVLFALHLRIQLVLVGCESVGCKHALQEYIEHGHTFLVLNETSAADNTYHS